MSDTAAATAPDTTTPATTTESAGANLSDIKAAFARAIGADEPAPEAAEEPGGKPERSPDGKFKVKDKAATKEEPKKEPESDPEDKPPTNGERAKFRAERRAFRQAQAELAAERDKAARMFAHQREMWRQFDSAKRDGRVIDAIQALGFDAEEVARQLAEQAMGNDPRLTAMQRQMAELEAQRERERLEQAQRQADAQREYGARQWNAMLARTLSDSDDEIIAGMAQEPDILDAIRVEQERAWEDDCAEVGAEEATRRQRTPAAMLRAARVVAREATSAHTRLGRLLRKVAQSADTETGAEQPSAPGELKTRGKGAPRSLGASQGTAKPRQPATFDTNTHEGRRSWKAHFEAMLKNSTD